MRPDSLWLFWMNVLWGREAFHRHVIFKTHRVALSADTQSSVNCGSL